VSKTLLLCDVQNGKSVTACDPQHVFRWQLQNTGSSQSALREETMFHTVTGRLRGSTKLMCILTCCDKIQSAAAACKAVIKAGASAQQRRPGAKPVWQHSVHSLICRLRAAVFRKPPSVSVTQRIAGSCVMLQKCGT
jgi:hypothetical protein